MNNYSDGKCFEFGKLLRNEFNNQPWLDTLNSDDFAEFINGCEIRTQQIEFIRRGYCDEDIDGVEKESVGIFTFGLHKDKPFTAAPEEYIVWLSKKSWLKNHPQLSLYVTEFLRKKESMSKEDLKSEFAKIKDALK